MRKHYPQLRRQAPIEDVLLLKDDVAEKLDVSAREK
jgi:hypothetical protein